MKHYLISLLFVLNLVFAVAVTAFAVPTKNRPNTLGIAEFYQNPNIYLFGTLACRGENDCSLLRDAKERVYTNLKFQPFDTPSLYEEPVLFCGDVSASFNGKSGPLVVTYRRQATLNYRGIGCHDLDSVFEVHADAAQE